MDCRLNCGACCIGLSISSPIPGLSNGKPAGERCIHLDDYMRCRIFNDPARPKVCADFKPEPLFCRNTREEALALFQELENPISKT